MRLDEQDRTLWDRGLIVEGLGLVERALASRRFGPYTLQAAIVAVHAQAPRAEDTDWARIVALYDAVPAVADDGSVRPVLTPPENCAPSAKRAFTVASTPL